MGKKKNNRKKRQPQHTPLKSHAKKGTRLIAPLGDLNVRMLDFERDLLPEHLWLASLAAHYGLKNAHRPFAEFLDALDEFWQDDEHPCVGLISDFGRLPVAQRGPFLTKYRDLANSAFHDPLGRIMSFYPDGPAYWLVNQTALAGEGSIDPEIELPRLRKMVHDLLPAKDWHAGHLRLLPFTRMLKHGKIFFPHGLDVVELMPRYPDGLTEEEQFQVQQFARTLITSMYPQSGTDESAVWPKYFWRHNWDLVTCRPTILPLRGTRPVQHEEGQALGNKLAKTARIVRRYLDELPLRIRMDLYDPSRDEILFGLFARVSRLLILMASDPNLWARDTGGIMLRCLADTAITFSYLAVAGTVQDFKSFRSYGEGQEKLLMLHLQDNYPDQYSIEGRPADAISGELGSFVPQVLDIELGHWSKKDTRKLASQAGLEKFYRLIYSPTSSDLHGTWVSLKNSNLSICAEVLHHFHRLPKFTEPPVFVNTVVAAQELYAHCVGVGIEKLGYPPTIEMLPSLLPDSELMSGEANP
jgi:hypothetical protein